MQIKELKKEFIEAIIEERTTNGPYASLQEFLDHYSNEMGKRNIRYSLVDTSSALDEPLFDFFTRS